MTGQHPSEPRPEYGPHRYRPGSNLDVAHAFGFREGYELAEKRAGAQRDRLRAALGVELDEAMLDFADNPSDYNAHHVKRLRAALTDDQEGET